MALNEDTLKEQINEELKDAATADISPEEAAKAAAEASEETDSEENTAESSDELNEEDKLKQELADKDDKMLRLQADFENFRRRTRQEKEELSAIVTQQILKDMLPLLDNFERALSAENDGEAFKTGIDMIYKQFQTVLK